MDRQKIEEQIRQTIHSYDETAYVYAEKTKDLLRKDLVDRFCEYIPQGSRILDLGCGNGRDAKVFSDIGYIVTGVDLSPKMLDIARKTSPTSKFYKSDIRQLKFPEESCEGIWALASFLHIPKLDIEKTLEGCNRVLVSSGVIHIGLKEGTGEELLEDKRYGEDIYKRYTYFENGEMEYLLRSSGFHIEHTSTITRNTGGYLKHPETNIFASKI
jgi:ubiquinone/menaquinone biosynthesis C-methylase UbiE